MAFIAPDGKYLHIQPAFTCADKIKVPALLPFAQIYAGTDLVRKDIAVGVNDYGFFMDGSPILCKSAGTAE